MRRLVHSLFAVACLWLPTNAQNAWPAEAEQTRHEMVVRAERSSAFQRAWLAADEDTRRRAADLLASQRSSGAPLGRRPGLVTVCQGLRVLEGAAPQDVLVDDLQRFADGIDLQVVPGMFAAVSQGEPLDGRGEPVTVRVYSTEHSAIEGRVNLSLYWQSSDGTETRARTEPFDSRSFSTPGFVAYLRAPRSPAATWQLVPEVRLGEQVRRGFPVPVDAVERPNERLAALSPERRSSLVLLWEKGMRTADGRTAGQLLAQLESAADPLERTRALAGGLESHLHAPEPDAGRAAAGPILVLLAPSGETAGSFLHGPVGDGWRSLARRRAALLLGLEVPATAGGTFRDTLEALREVHPGRPVHVIARGDAVTVLHFLLLGPGAIPDGLVLASPGITPGPSLPRVPILCLSAPDEGSERTGVTWEDGFDTAFLAELGLAARLERWLAELASAAGESR